MHRHWDVLDQESGSQLQAFLKVKLGKDFSARKIKKLIESNFCKVNGRTERFASYIIGHGDRIDLLSDIILPSPSLTFDTKRILFEDKNLLCYNKPSGIASDNRDWLSNLQVYDPNLLLAHRLDKDTTGVLIFAKTKQALEQVTELFRKRLIKKEYLALVDGIPAVASGKIDNYLLEEHRYQGQTLWRGSQQTKGLHAITEWQLEASGKDAALIRCYPKTGRTHQLRVHLSEMGHPILGDYQYGRQFRCPYTPPRHLLHATSINFHYPISCKHIFVQAPLPEDFCQALNWVIE